MEFNKPECLKLTGNVAENFKLFKEEVMVFFEATETTAKPVKVQVARLLNLIGSDGVKLYRTFNVNPSEETIEIIFEKLEGYCTPKRNEVMEHYKFFMRKQDSCETFDKFYADLRDLIKNCDFGKTEDKLLRTQIVLGISDKDLQGKLLREDLNLDKVVRHCQATEQAEINRKLLVKESENKIDFIEKKKFDKYNTTSHQGKKQQRENVSEQYSREQLKKTSKEKGKVKTFKFNCYKCGKTHSVNECPAYNKNCNICGYKNHFAIMCKNKIKSESKQLNIVEEDDKVTEYLLLEKIGVGDTNNTWTDTVKINELNVEIKLDTGAQLNVMPIEIYKKIKSVQLEKSEIIIKTFGGFTMKSQGKINVKIENDKCKTNVIFEIVDYEGMPILGFRDCKTLKYKFNGVDEMQVKNKKENFVKENIDIFTGLGKFPDKIKIKVKENSIPVVSLPRRIPIKLVKKLKELIERLCAQNIIEKCEEPSEWQHPLVVIEKPDKSLRMCLDPRVLNKCIVREMVQIPTVDEIRNKLTNKKYFTLCDLKDGFYQCELESDSMKLCAFSTPFGSYQFRRLPFGLANAPEMFQQLTSKYFGCIKNVCVYFDDILISGETQQEHDEALKQVVKQARKLNIKFNLNKLQYEKNEVKFLGMVFNEKGITPDPERVKSIVELKIPQNIKQLQSFLGMVNYLRLFIPNMSELVEPLRSLLRKDSVWSWGKNCDIAFNKLKSVLTELPTLGNYNAKDVFTIQCDASEKALGCCLFQNNRPVYYASRCLSETEQMYAQVEKEMLGMVFACKKFHKLIYGQDIIKIFTDHQPLISIMKKEINKIPNNRLRRMRLKLMNYNTDVEYCPGKYMYIADLLSRNYVQRAELTDESLNDVVHTIKEFEVQFSNSRLKQFIEETYKDEHLGTVLKYLDEGWPKKIVQCGEIRHYFKIKNELIKDNEVIYYENRIVVPKMLRKYIIKKLHETHIGITKTLKKSKQIFYWPGMSSDLKSFIEGCEICKKFSCNKTKEPLLQHTIPEFPFQKVGIDIAEVEGSNYLVVMDYFSRWIEVLSMKNKTSETVIALLKIVFSRFGIPEEIVADNNPCGSREFKQFAEEWHFNITLSSPNYPRSNGLAEKAVGIAKNMIKKAKSEKQDLNLYLLNYRNSPVAGLSCSPSQMLQSRELRTTINSLNKKIFKPKVVDCSLENKIKKLKQKKWYDRSASSEEKEFRANEQVMIQDKLSKLWSKAMVVSKTKWPRSYLVKDEKGKILRRNTIFMRKFSKCDLDLDEGEEEIKNDQKEVEKFDRKEDNKVLKSETNSELSKTKSGRVVKKPIRLDL